VASAKSPQDCVLCDLSLRMLFWQVWLSLWLLRKALRLSLPDPGVFCYLAFLLGF
jgi:hypothetical protein